MSKFQKLTDTRFSGIKKLAKSTEYKVLSAVDKNGASMMRVVIVDGDFRNPVTFRKYNCRDVNTIMSAKNFGALRLLTKGGGEGFELVKII